MLVKISLLISMLLSSFLLTPNKNLVADEHDHSSWTSWTNINSLPTNSGSYVLEVDVTLNNNWSFSGTSDDPVKLCLNGHKVDLNTKQIRPISKRARLEIYDCNETKKEYYFKTDGEHEWELTDNKNQENVETIKGGIITNGGATTTGREAIDLGSSPEQSGYFVLCGGTLVGNRGYYGVIRSRYGSFNMRGGCICGNYSAVHGGVFYGTEQGGASVYGGIIRNNKAEQSGGAFYLEQGTLFMGSKDPLPYPTDDELIIENNVAGNGGAIYLLSNHNAVDLYIYKGVIRNNIASKLGGGIYEEGGDARIQFYRGLISNNNCGTSQQDGHGGANIYASKGAKVRIYGEEGGDDNPVISSENANNAYCGGGICLNKSEADIKYATFENCYAINSGGAIYADAESVLSIKNSVIRGCKSGRWGGGIFTWAVTSLINTTITDCTVITPDGQNNADSQGAGVFYRAKDNNTSITLGGATKIVDNYTDGKANNLHLIFDNRGLAVNSTIQFDTVDVPNENMNIGVSTSVSLFKEGQYGDLVLTKDANEYLDYFVSDSADYELIYNEDHKIVQTKHAHHLIHQEGKAPTYEEPGYSEYWYCDKCGRYYSDEFGIFEILNLDEWKSETGGGFLPVLVDYHQDMILIPGKNPTRDSAGYSDCYQCSVCGDYFEDAGGCFIIGDEEALEEWRATPGKGYLAPVQGRANDVDITSCASHWVLLVLFIAFIVLNILLYLISDFSLNVIGIILSLAYAGVNFVFALIPHCGFCTALIIIGFVFSILALLYWLIGGHFVERDDDSWDFKDIQNELKNDFKKVKRGTIKVKSNLVSKVKKNYDASKDTAKIKELDKELEEADSLVAQKVYFEATKKLTKKTPKDISKKSISDYLVKTFKGKVEVNNRNNDIIKGFIPLPDTHFTLVRKCKDGSEKPAYISFAYVYEFENRNVCLLLKLTCEQAKELQKKHEHVYRAKTPESKKAWFAIAVDSTFTKEEVFELVKMAKDNSELPSDNDPLASVRKPFKINVKTNSTEAKK